MTLLAAVLTCSLHNDDALVRAIADNAHDNPYAIVNLEVDPDEIPAPTPPRTLDAAVAQLNDLLAQGITPVIGLMQVPVTWAASFGREPQELFDPCINVSIGSAMLSAYDYACTHTKRPGHPTKPPGPRARRACVLHRYAEAVGMPDLETVVRLELRYQHAPPAPAADSPILTAPVQPAAWGASSLLLPTAPIPALRLSDAPSTPSPSAPRTER
jgi:hypothetical protein